MNSRWDAIAKSMTAALFAGALGGTVTLDTVSAEVKILSVPSVQTAAAKAPLLRSAANEQVAQATGSETKPEAQATPQAEPKPEADAKPEAEAKPETATAAPAATPAAAAPAQPAADAPTAAISEPTDPVAKAAFDVMDKHCARCHQVGRLDRQKPSKNFGNVLALDEMARDPNLVLPGNPDGSRLFVQMAKQEMPYDVYQEFSGGAEPTKEELQAVYDWIKGLGSAVVASCADRKLIGADAIVTAIAADLDNQLEHRRKGMRYITLSHLYNSCVDEKDMVRFRQGVVKLLNSLSQESDVLKLRTIDEAKTIIAFHLDDLKWNTGDWDRLLKVYPYGVKPETTVYDSVVSQTGTPLAWIRGDWFGFSASRPPLYHHLVRSPNTFQGLQKQVGVDVEANIAKFLAKRAGFQISGVSKHNRLIERHSINTGYFWTSYDFKGDTPEQSLFERPLGPTGPNGFKHDGGETIYSLPNGFQAYYLNTAEGGQLDKGPTEIVLDDSQLDRSVTNGISCFGCHNQGIRRAKDDVRAHVLADRTFPKKVREHVEALYPPHEEMDRILDEDYNRFRSAMLRAGLDPDLDARKAGVESINFLSKQYEKALDLRIAAAEFGITSEQLAEGLGASGGADFRIRRRLQQGTIPRETFEARYASMVDKVSDNEALDTSGVAVAAADVKVAVAKVGGKSKEATHDFDLALFSDQSIYKVNDFAVFTVRSKEDCHLTLINVDAKGVGTVIFPNKFQQANLLPAGKELKFPGPRAPFRFRLKDPGTETVVAVCNATGKAVDGIKHDFKKRQFTELGNYRQFLTRQIVVEATKKVTKGKKAKAAGKKKAKPTIFARTAIKFKVK